VNHGGGYAVTDSAHVADPTRVLALSSISGVVEYAPFRALVHAVCFGDQSTSCARDIARRTLFDKLRSEAVQASARHDALMMMMAVCGDALL
jgi:hypothetical protein